jgi:3-(3-hydroxy-phenyl)propionate hydroxylase
MAADRAGAEDANAHIRASYRIRRMPQRPPVVIAGAGPTGLMCALALASQGIPVVVCEAEASLTHDLRAGSYHPPTQDMMAKYGITQRMHGHALQVRHWQIRERQGSLTADFDLGVLADVTAYPYRLHLEQHRLTPIQLDILRRQTDARVYFGHRVTGFEQKGEKLKVRVESDGIPGTFEASWLIGADGGRSTVRKLLPIEFEGFTWPEQFLVVSTPYDFGRHAYPLNAYVADPVEWVALFKMPNAGPPGVWRVVFPCDPGMPDDALLDAEHVEAKLQAFQPNGARYEVQHKVIYRVHQRVASEWRMERVLLAGDAAHLNNPLGAFGLNSGIHDAVNLADKLGRVWRGEADEALLDRYVRQRRAACVDQVQAMSIRNKRLLEERDPQVQRARMEELVATAADPEQARAFLLESSMISGLRKIESIE